MAENLNLTEELENGTGRALLVSVSTTDKADECNRSLDELERLLETAGGVCAARVIQNRATPDNATYFATIQFYFCFTNVYATTNRAINGILNGDILLWNPILKRSLELSSMGIRVDKRALLKQLKLEGCEERRELAFHKALLNDELPLSIGGGIGQSRVCMFFLRCAHIGEVQVSLWDTHTRQTCAKHNIILL